MPALYAASRLGSADLADYVARVIQDAPPLTTAQQDRLGRVS